MHVRKSNYIYLQENKDIIDPLLAIGLLRLVIMSVQ